MRWSSFVATLMMLCVPVEMEIGEAYKVIATHSFSHSRNSSVNIHWKIRFPSQEQAVHCSHYKFMCYSKGRFKPSGINCDEINSALQTIRPGKEDNIFQFGLLVQVLFRQVNITINGKRYCVETDDRYSFLLKLTQLKQDHCDKMEIWKEVKVTYNNRVLFHEVDSDFTESPAHRTRPSTAPPASTTNAPEVGDVIKLTMPPNISLERDQTKKLVILGAVVGAMLISTFFNYIEIIHKKRYKRVKRGLTATAEEEESNQEEENKEEEQVEVEGAENRGEEEGVEQQE